MSSGVEDVLRFVEANLGSRCAKGFGSLEQHLRNERLPVEAKGAYDEQLTSIFFNSCGGGAA